MLCAPGFTLQLAVEQRLLDLADGPRHVDPARARLDAIEDGAAAPHALGGIQNLQPFLCALVTAVKNEAMGVDDRRGPHVIRVGPERRARSRTRSAKDAPRGFIVSLAFDRRMQSYYFIHVRDRLNDI